MHVGSLVAIEWGLNRRQNVKRKLTCYSMNLDVDLVSFRCHM